MLIEFKKLRAADIYDAFVIALENAQKGKKECFSKNKHIQGIVFTAKLYGL